MDNNISGIGLRFHGINPLSKYHPSKSQGIEMHNIFILCLVYNTYLFIIKFENGRLFFRFVVFFDFPPFLIVPPQVEFHYHVMRIIGSYDQFI